MRNAISIFCIVGLMCAIATFQTMMCESQYVRTWPSREVQLGGTTLQAQLITTRVHTPNDKGRYRPYDELCYTIEFDASKNIGAADFLRSQTNRHPEIWVFDKDGQPTITPLGLALTQVTGSQDIYRAKGSCAYPKEIQKAVDWTIQWDVPKQQSEESDSQESNTSDPAVPR